MSDQVALGDTDADNRWIGIRRHQALLVVVGIGLSGDWLISSHKTSAELALGIVTLVAAVPTFDGLTLGQLMAHVALFFGRPHWGDVRFATIAGDVEVWSKRHASFALTELIHRGRLDLSERDESLVEATIALVDGWGASNSATHLSQHLLRGDGDIVTLMAVPSGVLAIDGWRSCEDPMPLTRLASGTLAKQFLETLTSLWFHDGVRRIYRVRDFSSVGAGRGLLDQFLRSSASCDVAHHVHVLSGTKGQRVASRAVHRMGSDEATSRSAGFRRTARSQQGLERLRHREDRVASGRALLQTAVYVIVHAPNAALLNVRSKEVWRDAQQVGLRLERGWGCQASWFRAQLPGGGSW